MTKKKPERKFIKRIAIDVAGFSMIIAAPLLGWLPGPGGIPLFVGGLALLASNHVWAERILRNFDQKRLYYTNKYLLGNPRVSWTIDIVSVLIFGLGTYLLLSREDFWLRWAGIGCMTVSLIIILSNQKRLDRLAGRAKKGKK